jgi:hypothetical protein
VPGRRRQKRTDRSKLDATPPWEHREHHEPDATTGPYDERDVPEDGVTRIDLGALRVPVVDGYDVRVDLNEAQQVIAATLAAPEGTMQLGVFAAPRNEGIWDDVRAEIADSLNAQRKDSARESTGPFGTELHGNLPAENGKGTVPVRSRPTPRGPSASRTPSGSAWWCAAPIRFRCAIPCRCTCRPTSSFRAPSDLRLVAWVSTARCGNG